MDVMQNQSSNQDLLCCRACLATDCRLYNIHENKLADAFFRISGTAVLKDQLPQYLCSYCCCLLLKCASFRAICLETPKCLSLELLNGELNTKSILRLDRPAHRLNLTLSVVNIIEYVETRTTDIKQEPNDVINTDEPATTIKCEGNIDIDGGNLSETSIDDINLSESSIDDINLGEPSIYGVHLGESWLVDIKLNEPHVDDIDLSEPHLDDIKTYEPHIDVVNIKCEGNIDIDGGNLSETSIDDINLGEPHIDVINLSEPHIDVINLSESHTDLININEPHIDVINLYEPQIDVVNISETHIDDAHVDVVDVHKIKKRAYSKKRLVKKKVKKYTVKSKDTIDNDEKNTYLSNKLKTIKTYTRKLGTTTKKNMIEIQGYSEVNDKIDKDEADINLNEADLDKDKRTITVRYTHPDLAEDESDIEDINEIETRMEIVNIECNVKEAVKKPKTTVEKKKSDSTSESLVVRKRQSCLSDVRLAHPALNVVCDICGETFVSDFGLLMHKSMMYSECLSAFRYRQNRPAVKRYPCPHCPEAFRTKAARKVHQRIHVNATCHVCACVFRTRRSMLLHVKSAHNGQAKTNRKRKLAS